MRRVKADIGQATLAMPYDHRETIESKGQSSDNIYEDDWKQTYRPRHQECANHISSSSSDTESDMYSSCMSDTLSGCGADGLGFDYRTKLLLLAENVTIIKGNSHRSHRNVKKRRHRNGRHLKRRSPKISEEKRMHQEIRLARLRSQVREAWECVKARCERDNHVYRIDDYKDMTSRRWWGQSGDDHKQPRMQRAPANQPYSPSPNRTSLSPPRSFRSYERALRVLEDSQRMDRRVFAAPRIISGLTDARSSYQGRTQGHTWKPSLESRWPTHQSKHEK